MTVTVTATGQALRRVVTREERAFRPYDRYGTPIEAMSWHPITDDCSTGEATFFLRLDPGYRGGPHEHLGIEEFLVLEGEMIDPDERIFRPGDFVSYQPGSRHWSRSPGGCLLLVFLRAFNRALNADEAPVRVGVRDGDPA